MANKIGIVLALDGEREFTQGMRNAQQSAKLCDQELKNLNKQYEGQANTLEALAKKQETLKSKQEAYNRTLDEAKKGQKNAVDNYKKAGERLEELKGDLDKARRAMEDMERAGDTSSKAYKDQAKAVEDLENAVKKQSEEQSRASGNITKWDTAVAKAKGDVEQTSRAIDKNSQYLDEASKSADGCATSIDKMGKEASDAAGELDKVSISLGDMVKAKAVDLAGDAVRALGQKAAEAAEYVIDVGSKFEASMSKVEALSGASADQLEKMSQKAQELGSSTKFSASEVADGFSYMALAGWDAQQSIAAIDGIVNLAAASEMDLAEASDMVTDYLSAFGMEASEAGKMADMMAYAQANSNTSTRQLGDAFGNCAANMNAAGQDMQTTTSFLEAFANQGIKGSEAGTKLSAIMRDITAKMQDGKIQIGDTAVAVMDANGNFRDLTDIMVDVEAATEGMGTAERSAALSATFTSRSVGGLNMILAEGMENISGYEDALNSCDGAASTMAGTMQDNLQGAITEMNSAAEGLGIALYDKVSGPLTDAVRLATELLSGITDAITPEKTALEQFIEDVGKANESINTQVEGANAALDNGAAEVAKIDSLAETIKAADEAFNIFAEKDISDSTIVSSMETVAEETGTSFQTIVENAGGAAEAVTGVGEADPSGVVENLSDTAEGIAESTENISSSAEAAKEGISDIGNADSSGAVNNVKTTAEGIGESVETIESDATRAKTSVESIGDADPSKAGENVKNTESAIKEGTEAIAKDAAGAASAITGIGEADPSGAGENIATEEAAVLEGTNKIVEDATAATDAITGIEDADPSGAGAKVTNAESEIKAGTDLIAEDAGSAKNAISAIGDATIDTEGITGDLSAMGDAIEASTEKMDAYQWTQVKAAVDELAQSIPALSGCYDDLTRTLTISETEFDALINTQKRAVLESAFVKAQAEATDAWAASLVNLEYAQSGVEQAFREASEAAGREINDIEVLKNALEYETGTLLTEKIKEDTEEAIAKLKDAEAAHNSAAEAMEKAQEVADRAAEEYGFLDETTQAVTESTDQATEATESFAESEEEAADTVEKAQERIKAAHKDAAEVITEAYEDAKEAAESAFEVNPFDTWEVNEENGVQKFQEALDSQIDGITKYAENLDVVRDNLGKTSPQLLKYIEDMGTDGAQLVKELADAFDPANGDPQKAEDLINSFVKYLDAQDSISTVLAADKVAIESGLRELGSSDAEFDQLGAAIGQAFQNLGPEMASELGNVVRQAKELGVKIPEGLQEGIESGELNAGQVLNELQSAMTGQLESLVDVARERGVAVDEALVDGIENGTADPVEAFNQLINSISGQNIDVSGMTDAVSESMATAVQDAASNAEQAAADSANVGEALASETAAGIEGKAGDVASAAESMAKGAASSAQDQTQAWNDAGGQSASEYASGILSGATSASSNAVTMVQTALISANGQTSGFYSVGQNIGQGVANGIQSMIQQVANQAANMVRSAMTAAKQAAAIQSPSKKFQDEVGKQIGAGVAFGIKQSTKQVEAEAEAQMGKTLNAMRRWLTKNKAGADGIAYAWQALASNELKRNFGILDYTTKKNNKTGEVTKTQKSDEAYYNEVLQAARQYLTNVQALYDVTEKEELAYWKKVGSNLKAGTEAWYTAQAQIKRLRKSISDDAKAEKEQAKKEAEEAKAEAKKAAAEAAEEKKKAAKELAAKTGNYSVASELLDTYTIYNELSERETVEYWDRIRKQFKAGTEDRIKADRSYYAAKRSYDRQLEAEEKSHAEKVKEIRDDLAADRLEVETDLAENLADLNQQLAEDIEELTEDLAKSITDLNKDLEKSIDSLTKELDKEIGTLQDELGKGVNDLNASYENAVNSRYNSIMGAFNFSEAFESMSATGEDLLFNMESQAAGYEDWMKTVEQLRARGILSDALMSQLIDKGPKETAAIHALLSLTDEELKRYQAAYDRKSTAAMEQATRDNEGLKRQVAADIAALKNETSAKIDTAKSTNATKIKELQDDNAAKVNELKNSNAAKINELKSANAAKADELKTTASTKLASLEQTASNKLDELNRQHGQKLDTLNGTVNGVSVAVRTGLVTLSNDISKYTEDNIGKITAAIANIDLKASNEAKQSGDTASASKAAATATKAVIAPTQNKTNNTDRINSLERQINSLNDQIRNLEALMQDARRRGATREAADFNGQLSSMRAQRDALVKELDNLRKSPGYKSGTRSVLGSGLDWIHENEIWINNHKNAMAVPFTSGDAVIPATLTDNLFKWGAIDPDSLASGAEMNRMLLGGYTPGRQAQQDTLLFEQMIGILSEMLPSIQARQNIYLDSGQLVGGTAEGTSNELAMRQRRRRL